MFQCTLVNLIKEKINYTRLIFFISIVVIIGIGLQRFESYPMFSFLFPVLLSMLVSVVLILQSCLQEIDEFQQKCESDDIKKYCKSLFLKKNNYLLLVIYILMVTVYFVCIYRLQFVEINLMGLYIVLLGGSTFFLALISYEVCVRLTNGLKEAEKNIRNIEYNKIYPKDTLWLQYFAHLHIVLKDAALIISMLFVLENSMLFVANKDKLSLPNLSNDFKILDFLKGLPLEWLVIWIYILVTIVLALPFMIWLRNKRLRKIISYIQTNYNKEMMEQLTIEDLKKEPQKYYSILKIMQNIQNSLDEAYLPQRFDRIISLCASLLTCFAHLISFCMVIIPVLPK